MPIHRPFSKLVASRRVTRRRYAEEWRWWATSAWKMFVEDGEDGGLLLVSVHRNGTSWGADATAEEAATPEGVRRFLTEALYLHLHPIKAEWSYATTGKYCTEAELAAFIRQQRRKIAKPAA